MGNKVKLPDISAAMPWSPTSKAFKNDKTARGGANQIVFCHIPWKQMPMAHKDKATTLLDRSAEETSRLRSRRRP